MIKVIIISDDNIEFNFPDLIFAKSQNTVSRLSKGIESAQYFKEQVKRNRMISFLNLASYFSNVE